MNLFNIGIAVIAIFFLKRITVTHANLRIIIMFWIISYFSQNTGQIVFMISILVNDSVTLSGEFSVPTVARYFIFFGIFLVRFLLIFTSIERIIATIWLDTYEKRQNTTLFSTVFVSSLVNLIV